MRIQPEEENPSVDERLFDGLEIADEHAKSSVVCQMGFNSKSGNLQGYKLPPYVEKYSEGLISQVC